MIKEDVQYLAIQTWRKSNSGTELAQGCANATAGFPRWKMNANIIEHTVYIQILVGQNWANFKEEQV